MRVSRELDALVAEKVFGYTLDYEFADLHVPLAPHVKELRDQYDEWGMLPAYSADIADAWLVVERMLEMRGADGHARKEQFIENVRKLGMGELTRWNGRHAAHIICLAALAALDIEVPA